MEHLVYLQSIKSLLKARGIKYTELASFLGMSESGVKKMLNSSDISMRRLAQITDLLGVTPKQLFSLAEDAHIPTASLSARQESALLKDRMLLSVFWRLVVEKCEAKDIGLLQGMPEKQVLRYMQKLVRLELLKEVGDTFLPVHTGKFRWDDKSKLAKALNVEWSQLILKRALSSDKDHLHRLVTTQLSAKSYQAFLSKVNDLIDETVRVSEREELTYRKEELKNISLTVAVSPKGVFDGDEV